MSHQECMLACALHSQHSILSTAFSGLGFGLQLLIILSALPLGKPLGKPPPPPSLLTTSPQVTSCSYDAYNNLCHHRVLCFGPCILKAELLKSAGYNHHGCTAVVPVFALKTHFSADVNYPLTGALPLSLIVATIWFHTVALHWRS